MIERCKVKEHKHERAATEFEGDAEAVSGGTLNQTGMARRSFLGRAARWSAALAVIGLAPEAWMQAVFRRSVMSSAVASGSTRNRALHPFPADDPFNMPLGVNAWYAPMNDPATLQLRHFAGDVAMYGPQGSKPIWLPTAADPIHRFYKGGRSPAGSTFFSIRAEEHMTDEMFEHLQIDAIPALNEGRYEDRHLRTIFGNEVVELFEFYRDGGDFSGIPSGYASHGVRNALDRYAFGTGFNETSSAVGGTRAWGGSSLAGAIRKHEIERPDPHIPHALTIALDHLRQAGNAGKGDPSSPLHNISFMFPANKTDAHGFNWRNEDGSFRCVGNGRMGMRIALDPTICTDAWIEENAPKLVVATRGHPAGVPNPWQVALAKALRDYGGILTDTGPSLNYTETELGVAEDVLIATKWRNISGTEYSKNWRWLFKDGYVRRVAGRTSSGGSPIHIPTESHWDTWRANGQGWGGGAPRVPYSRPLSGDLPPATPEAPGAIQVSAARILDGTE